MNLPSLLTRLWHHLTHRRQRQFGLLMGLMLISAFAEVVSLGAVLPFLGILVAPDRVFGQGTYEQLLERSHSLRRMARAI